MHNRRFGSLLIGGWLIGTMMVWFFTSQSLLNVDRLLATPPLQIQKELADMGIDTAGNLLRHQAREVNRRVVETWEILQIGIAGALLVTSILTTHRSKTTIGCAFLLMAMAAVSAFYLTPSMNALGRSFDFLPSGAESRERDAFLQMQVSHRVLDVLKLLVALIASVRLLFDFYEFRDKFASSAHPHSRRRRRSSHADRSADRDAGSASSAAPGAAPSNSREAGSATT